MSTPHLIGLIFVSALVLWGFGIYCGAMLHSNHSATYHASRRAVVALESAEMRRIREAHQVRSEPATVIHNHIHLPPQEPRYPTWQPSWRDMPAIAVPPLIEGEVVHAQDWR